MTMLLYQDILAATGMAASAVATPCGGHKAGTSISASSGSTAAHIASKVSAAVVKSSSGAASRTGPPACTTSTAASSSVSTETSTKASSSRKMKFFSVNESGPETFISKGMITFLIDIMMERLIPTDTAGTLDAGYLADLKTTVGGITSKGAYAMICPHNYGRYYNNIITDIDAFGA
ncbi:hypothetical protein NA57DRAFT_76937 [Rhizodiscina lignyota]|uniref:cellulase n=1 Tax=Rhizodiscina lignyota TaxID=1504668 RepID=A0A9P4M5J4_9PEZI|nr:hypothetical protein NA57DRAFT_76937 [Rhizodiscina lignyota]